MRIVVSQIPRLIWRRLPWIVAYTLAITGLLFLGEFAYHRYSAGERFIKYTSFRVNTATEHQDVAFEACKETDYPYKIEGDRQIYKIPEGKGEIDKVRVGGYKLDSIISKEPCVSAFITTKQYDFSPGNYQVYTTFNFTTKYGNRKSVTFKSNIFAVLAVRPTSVKEIQKRIEELQKQIDLLKLQLRQQEQSTKQIEQQNTQNTQSSKPQATVAATPEPQTQASQSDPEPRPDPKPEPTPEPEPEQPQPSVVETIIQLPARLLDRIL